MLSGGLISGASGSGTGIAGGTVNLLAGGSAAFVGVSSGGTFNVAGTVLSNGMVFAGGIENVLVRRSDHRRHQLGDRCCRRR